MKSPLIKYHDIVTKEFALKNIIAKFKVIKESNQKGMIISVCAFRINKPYKDETMYREGIINAATGYNKHMNCTFRVYYDKSIYKDNEWDSAWSLLKKWIMLI